MKLNSSRRNFLAAGLALPAAGMATVSPSPSTENRKPFSNGDLRYKTLGRTGLKVTTVGFGCMVTSDQSVIEKAVDLGIKYFDTARGYQGGNNERMVGAALKGKRKGIVLSTKSHAKTKDEALTDLDTSLKTLGTDYVDIWYLHAKTKPEQVTDELIDAQQTAKKAGKIRFAGVSTHSGQVDLIPALIKRGNVDVVLAAYNFSMDQKMSDAIAAAHKAGMGVVAMKVMAGGFRRAKPGDKTYETLKREGAMAAALKWVLNDPNVDTTIPSITDVEQLDENLKAMSATFSDADKKVLARQLDFIRPLYCRTCGHCEGARAKGLPVADIIRYLSYAEGYGQYALGREHFLELPASLAAVRCGDCSACTIECPNGVRVAQRVSRAQEIFA